MHGFCKNSTVLRRKTSAPNFFSIGETQPSSNFGCIQLLNSTMTGRFVVLLFERQPQILGVAPQPSKIILEPPPHFADKVFIPAQIFVNLWHRYIFSPIMKEGEKIHSQSQRTKWNTCSTLRSAEDASYGPNFFTKSLIGNSVYVIVKAEEVANFCVFLEMESYCCCVHTTSEIAVL